MAIIGSVRAACDDARGARLLAVEELVVEVARARIEHAPAQEIDRAVDEVALLAVEEVEGARLAFAQGSERIGAGGSCHWLHPTSASTILEHFRIRESTPR